MRLGVSKGSIELFQVFVVCVGISIRNDSIYVNWAGAQWLCVINRKSTLSVKCVTKMKRDKYITLERYNMRCNRALQMSDDA